MHLKFTMQVWILIIYFYHLNCTKKQCIFLKCTPQCEWEREKVDINTMKWYRNWGKKTYDTTAIIMETLSFTFIETLWYRHCIFFHINNATAVVFFARIHKTYTHTQTYTYATLNNVHEITFEPGFHSRCYCNTQMYNKTNILVSFYTKNCFRFLLSVTYRIHFAIMHLSVLLKFVKSICFFFRVSFVVLLLSNRIVWQNSCRQCAFLAVMMNVWM